MLRMKDVRDIWVRGRRCNIREVAEGVNLRAKYSSYARFGAMKGILWLQGREYPVTLVSYKDRRNKDIVIWVTSGWVKSTVEMKRRIRGYFKRWGVEERYRFEKQGFGIEKAAVRKYGSIKTLLGLSLLSWLALIRINENPNLITEVQKAARAGEEQKETSAEVRLLPAVAGRKEPVCRGKRNVPFPLETQSQKGFASYLPSHAPIPCQPDCTCL
jgi:hypothetical protein